MVSVGVSALGRTNLHFVDPGIKVNGQYYRDILLLRDLLPDIKQYSDYFTFQQDGAPAHRARETVKLLKVEMPGFIPPNLWPPNSPDLNPVDYKIWGVLQERVFKTSIKDVDELRRRIAEEYSSWGVAKETSSMCGCRWRTVWTQDVNNYHFWYFVSKFSDQTLESLLFCSVKTGCFVEYYACYLLYFKLLQLYYATQTIFIKYAIASHIAWKQIL